MSETNKYKLSRREFAAGGVAAAALAGSALLGKFVPVGEPAQEQKPEPGEPQAAQQAEDWEAQALRAIREFKMSDQTEPAFAFQAAWPNGRGSR